MKADDLVCEVRVQAHAGGTSDRNIGAEAHEEGSEGCNGGSSSDKVAVDDRNTEGVVDISSTYGVCFSAITDTGTA